MELSRSVITYGIQLLIILEIGTEDKATRRKLSVKSFGKGEFRAKYLLIYSVFKKIHF